MESLLSRSSSSINIHHSTRKKTSFMAFKDKMSSSSDTKFLPHKQSLPSSPLSSNTLGYFDRYPRRPSSSPATPSRSRSQRRTTSSQGSERDDVSFTESIEPDGETGMELTLSAGQCYYKFPNSDSTEDVSTIFNGGHATPKPHSRTRSRSGPSSKPYWKPPSHVPPLRFSGSSIQTQVESPPQTPIDHSYFRPSIERYPVVVGVETMDAMVDGMNGLDSDSYFGDGGSRSKSYRSPRFAKIPNHHPLYQPPLPKPPPGVVLGRGKSQDGEDPYVSEYGEEEDEAPKTVLPTRRFRRRGGRAPSPSTSKSTITLAPISPRPLPYNHICLHSDTDDLSPRRSSYQSEDRKSLAPSISDIIRTHSPHSTQVRSKPTTRSMGFNTNHSHQATLREETESEPEPEPLTADEEAELMTRSSIDSIANEVRQTLRNQRTSKLIADPPPITGEHTYYTEGSNFSRFERRPTSSIFSSSVPSIHTPVSSAEPTSFISPASPSQAIAQYLRSTRLTTLLKLTRYPHATREQPLTVSLSDLGSPTGFPVVMFLGLGCVRHVMGLYDEMAEILGLRLITIDRWGLGRTDTPRPKSARGIMEWASVVEEVLDMLNIEHCSVMAHSAGAPYALSFANRAPDRIRGDICLLAPWVGGSESGGYKWLKYVPNGILKTAQAAEWKVQAWMIGKPPTIAYEGIGYNADPPTSPQTRRRTPNLKKSLARGNSGDNSVTSPDPPSRPSIDSSVFSEYDDLRDFDGRFESRSTLGAKPPSLHSSMTNGISNGNEPKRIPSKGFLKRLKSGSSNKSTSSPTTPSSMETQLLPTPGSSRKIKALRSMGSLRTKGSSAPNAVTKKTGALSPQLPEPPALEVGLGFDDIDWAKTTGKNLPSPSAMYDRPVSLDTTTSSSNTSDTFEWAKGIITDIPSTPPPVKRVTSERTSVSDKSSNGYAPSSSSHPRGRRSVSFSISRSSVPTSPVTSAYTSPYASSIITSTGGSYQAGLGNALIAASHAESAKGTHSDFLQILNHDNRPWGFQYSSYPHKVRVWYGDKDEKIAENAVRWMERNMGEDRCQVKVVKGADHALMYKSAVVIEVLERIREQARADACVSWCPPPM